MKLHAFIFIASITTLIIVVGLHAYNFISTGELVVLGVLSVVFGISSVLKIYNIK